MSENFDLVGHIIAFEEGGLDNQGVLDLFAHLIETGDAWSLQGSYGRTASALIEGKYISHTGKLLVKLDEEGMVIHD